MPSTCFRKRRTKRLIVCLVVVGTVSFYLGIYFLSKHQRQRRLRNKDFMHRYLDQQSRSLSLNSISSQSHSSESCVHPNLPLWNDDIQRYTEKVEPIKCTDDENWVYTKDGRFYISATATEKHGQIKCGYVPIANANDSFKTLRPIIPMLNGSTLLSDAFKVSCKSTKGHTYANFHACIAPVSYRQGYAQGYDKFNVLIYGFDSLSRHMFQRYLPKTAHYFTEILGGILLESYNIVGDGTTQALLPMLTGRRETEIPEVRRGKDGAQHIDDVLEFIWKRYEKRGYVTQWAEDMADIGTFTYRLLGFKNQPVTHYMRPFYLATIPVYSHFPRYCLGSKPRHKVYLDWLKEGLETNKGRNFFTFGFFSEYSHSNNNPVTLTDDDNVNFFRYLKDEIKVLDNTFLFVMSDHGIRYGSIRLTEQGKLEERMPYFGVYVPTKFRLKYPQKYQNLINNRHRLVVPSDIHKSLLDILQKESSSSDFDINRSSFSLFSEIPKNRTCEDAGIEPHWCACLQSHPVSVSDMNVIKSVHVTISKFNQLLKEVSSFCHRLTLHKILKAKLLQTNDKILKFKQSVDIDGRVADFSDKLQPKFIHYQVTFETVPGNGIFEATTVLNSRTGLVTVNERSVSRVNRYNDDPKCIGKWYPALRPFCFCR